MLPDGYTLRPLTVDDAAALAAAADRNREHLRRWEPARPLSWFSEAGQRTVVEERLRQVELGLYDCWLLGHGEDVVGAATQLSAGVQRGPGPDARMPVGPAIGPTGIPGGAWRSRVSRRGRRR